mgnify:CR=1 FL=1
MMQHLVYKCPKCQNTLLVSNKMLHDLRCTESNPATYENIISQQPQPDPSKSSTENSNNFNTPPRTSRRMSIKHKDGTMTDFRKEKDIKGKEELIAVKYDPQGNVISRKKADNVDEYDLNDANEDGEVNEFYNADVNYDPEKYYEVNEENERKYNNIKHMNNMNNFMNNNTVTVSNNQVIYETAAPQEIVYEAPAIYDQNVTVNKPIHETIISHDPNIPDTAYNDIIRNTINDLNKGNNLGNYNNPFNNVNINDVNYSQINTHSSTYQNFGMNNYNIGNSNIYSQASYNNNINFDGAGTSNNDFNNIQYPY